MRVFVSWSGGKDSCLAYYKALKLGFKVSFLLTMLEENGLRSRGHGVKADVIRLQAESLGVPIVFGKASWEKYEDEFKRILKNLKNSDGVEGGVFGDIRLEEHKEWVEKVCGEVGIKAFEPLWNKKYEELLTEFFGNGFEAIIVGVKANLVDKKWLGEKISWKFIEYLKNHNIDLFGEAGEYHSLVVSGPTFKRKISIVKSQKTFKDGYWFLDILKFGLS